MFVYIKKVSKKGNNYNDLYWRFKSGKHYHLNCLPLSIVNAIIDNYDVLEVEEI